MAAASATVFAHAILLTATPSQNSTVSGPDVAVHLRFSARIDSSRSRITVERADGPSRALQIVPGERPNELTARAAELVPGTYKLIWRVLASDGHMTSGQILFSVR